ncbi:CHAT domain-containing protein [bacterium M00.F.Ca.ET.228.01.1.1]|nr:CHAT domain-containing protein [bacterium M00.F.Ca.ET.228.01.1.1]TGR96543.1 CHAT domain-containing protein [bacterium M00.F.Ca.ET.191.01.1.1]TGT97779.1 CHAT domain-containing protein [bacterium M00.F.Ca.ET.155.01.1.1]
MRPIVALLVSLALYLVSVSASSGASTHSSRLGAAPSESTRQQLRRALLPREYPETVWQHLFAKADLIPRQGWIRVLKGECRYLQSQKASGTSSDARLGRIRKIDLIVLQSSSAELGTRGGHDLVDLADLRLDCQHADPVEIYDRLLASRPTGAQGNAVDAWLEVIAYSGESSAVQDDRTDDAVISRVRQMSEELGRIALRSGDQQSLMLRARLARSRAASFVNDPSELIESLPQPSSKWPKDLRIAVAEAYLTMHLPMLAEALTRDLQKDSVQHPVVRAAQFYARAYSGLQECADRDVVGSLKDDNARLLAGVLYVSPTKGVDLLTTHDNDGEALAKGYCDERQAQGNFANWGRLFDDTVAGQIASADHRLPSRIMATPDISAKVPLSMGLALRDALSARATDARNEKRLLNILALPRISRTLAERAKVPAKAQWSIVETVQIAQAWVLHLHSGKHWGKECVMTVDNNGRIFAVPVSGHARIVKYIDLTGDGVPDVLAEQFETSARYLSFRIMDVVNHRSFVVKGENDSLPRGEVFAGSRQGAQLQDLIISATHRASLFSNCVQCPGQRSYYVYRYSKDTGAFEWKAQYDTSAEAYDANVGGMFGLSEAAILSFNMLANISRLEEFEKASPRSSVEDRQQFQDLLADSVETAGALARAGDIDRARAYMRRVLSKLHAVANGDKRLTELDADANLAWAEVMLDLGYNAEAKEAIDDPSLRAVTLPKQVRTKVALVDAVSSFNLGDLTRALDQQRLLRASDEPAMVDYALFLESIGELSDARSLGNRMVHLWIHPKALILQARLARLDGHLDVAVRQLLFAMSIARSTVDREATAEALLEGAHLAQEQQNYVLVERFLVASIFESSDAWWTRNGTEVLLWLGRDLLRSGQTGLAQKVLVAATRIGKDLDPQMRAQAFQALSTLLDGEPKFQALQAAYDSAARYRGRLPGEARKVRYVASTDDIADQYFSAELARGTPPAEVLAALEQWRFQVFEELYSAKRLDVADQDANITGFQIQDRLHSGETLVVYYIGKSVAFAIVVNLHSTRLVQLKADRAGLMSLISDARRAFDLGSPAARRVIERDSVPVSLMENLQALHRELIAPLAIPPDTKRLIIVPDKIMHSVPWSAISDSGTTMFRQILSALGYASLNPLADRYTLNILPSALVITRTANGQLRSAALISSTWGLPDARKSPVLTDTDIAAMHGSPLRPLQSTAQETGLISSTLHIPPDSLLSLQFGPTGLRNSSVTSSAIIAGLRNKAVVHIAAHGVQNPVFPMASFLVLDPSSHGVLLRASDMATADLSKTEIAFLSACQTGHVEVNAGNEVMGFTRGLFAAGAKRLILTSWLVDDRITMQFSDTFYQRLAKSNDIANAYSVAVTGLRRQYSHPYYWAGYVLMSRD